MMTKQEWRDSLKVGDKVAVVSYVGVFVYKVSTATATQITVTSGHKFNRKTGRISGGSKYAHTSINPPTPENLDRAKLTSCRNWLKGLNIESLTLEQLERMYKAYKGT